MPLSELFNDYKVIIQQGTIRWKVNAILSPLDITDADVLDAMKKISGYIDITPGDFKEIYKIAYRITVERLAQSRMALDVMTPDVVSVMADTPLHETAATMARHNVSGLPVMNANHELLGVVSDKDFLKKLGGADIRSFMHLLAERLRGKVPAIADLKDKKAQDIMTAPAVTVEETTSVSEIAKLFEERNINRVPVLDQNGQLAGIVSRADLIRTRYLV